MSVGAAIPDCLARLDTRAILTFVVPATNGCNMKCPFCFISKRRENTKEPVLSPDDYAKFITEFSYRESISLIAIQGHEPLLPESQDYTFRILETGKKLRIPTSLVTNGFFLNETASRLASLNPSRLIVSIDADNGERHDKMRGLRGSFDKAIKGVETSAKYPTLVRAIAVGSILHTKRLSDLLGMPQLLFELGVKDWIVNAMLALDRQDRFCPAEAPSSLTRALRDLEEEAARFGISFTCDDEFDVTFAAVGRSDRIRSDSLRIRRLLNPSGVYRLLPTGECFHGPQIIRAASGSVPKWVPNEVHAADFCESLRGLVE